MGTPYVGEIRMFAGNFAPAGWAFCAGQLVPISENETLFNLIGTTYGGDGQETFALPNLCGRIPLHRSATMAMGETGGVEEVTLTANQIAAHNHVYQGTTGLGIAPTPAQNVAGQSGSVQIWMEDVPNAQLDPSSLMPSIGGNQPHDNMHPYLVVNYIISLFGIYPPPS